MKRVIYKLSTEKDSVWIEGVFNTRFCDGFLCINRKGGTILVKKDLIQWMKEDTISKDEPENNPKKVLRKLNKGEILQENDIVAIGDGTVQFTRYPGSRVSSYFSYYRIE